MSEPHAQHLDGYGVLTRRRLSRWIAALIVTSTAIAALIGFLGAGNGISPNHFNWSLAAVTGTAVGTVLLAGFTGALAWTTSGDVRATIRLADATQEDQRNRNRPIVVVRLLNVSTQQLDPSGRKTIQVLRLWIKNVGLAPALDLRFRASYGTIPVPTVEVISVVGVDEERGDRAISLAGLEEPPTGFVFTEFTVTGDCFDRTRTERHPILVLVDEGLPDQEREAAEEASLRAWLELMPGPPREQGTRVNYSSQVQNNGPADAEDVRLQLVDDSGQDYGSPAPIGTIRAHSASPIDVVCPYPQPRFSARLTWRDGRRMQQSREIDGAYQPLGLRVPPVDAP